MPRPKGPENMFLPVQAVTEALRDSFLKARGGKIADEEELKLGPLTGKEYKITIGTKRSARLRIFVQGNMVHETAVVGTNEQVASKDADTFLNSYRLPERVAVQTPPPPPPDTSAGGPTPILGRGAGDKFTDPAPDKGMLVGIDVWVREPGANANIVAARPVYRVGDKEVLGATRGTPDPRFEKPIEVRAKAGYAVGAINGRQGGISVAGFTLTFMKVSGAALDPKDRYDSEWVGGRPGKIGPTDKTQGGDGRPIIGIHGTVGGGALVGLGLILPPAPKK